MPTAPLRPYTGQRRAQAGDARNVKFLEGDPTEMQFDRPFDTVVGRLVAQLQNLAAGTKRSARSGEFSGSIESRKYWCEEGSGC